jgi:hypothetical protein
MSQRMFLCLITKGGTKTLMLGEISAILYSVALILTCQWRIFIHFRYDYAVLRMERAAKSCLVNSEDFYCIFGCRRLRQKWQMMRIRSGVIMYRVLALSGCIRFDFFDCFEAVRTHLFSGCGICIIEVLCWGSCRVTAENAPASAQLRMVR